MQSEEFASHLYNFKKNLTSVWNIIINLTSETTLHKNEQFWPCLLATNSHNFKEQQQNMLMTFQKVTEHLLISEELVRSERKAAFNLFFCDWQGRIQSGCRKFCSEIFRLHGVSVQQFSLNCVFTWLPDKTYSCRVFYELYLNTHWTWFNLISAYVLSHFYCI